MSACTLRLTSALFSRLASRSAAKYTRSGWWVRLAGLVTMSLPETARELMQFSQAVNWLRTRLCREWQRAFGQFVCSLQDLEKRMVGGKRCTKRVAAFRAIAAGEWTSELVGAWDAEQDLIAHAVALSHHPKPVWVVFICPDTSDEHWGSSHAGLIRSQ